jgi:hypothetical protein
MAPETAFSLKSWTIANGKRPSGMTPDMEVAYNLVLTNCHDTPGDRRYFQSR